MSRLRPTGLRARLLLGTLGVALVAVSALVLAFNLILDVRLRDDADSLLRERAAAQLRTLSVLDGRLRVPETLDRGAADTQTWIFSGGTTLEQPAGAAPASGRAALTLIGGASRSLTVQATHTQLYAVPVVQGSRHLGTLVVGASLRPYDSSAHAALLGSLVLGLLMVLGVAVLATWVIGRALAPVARMTAAAADWGEHDLSRRFLAGEPHDELSELAATFDRLLDRLAQSLEREQRFTAEISHELRTPLAKILAEAELAGAREGLSAHDRRALQSIRASAENLSSALDALLASARAHGNGRSSAAEARAATERAVKHVAQQTRNRANEPEIAVHVQSAAGGAGVAAEPELIERALMPLLENAARFARQRVDVSIAIAANRVIFTVHDDGPGVDPAIRERIFEPGVTHSPPAPQPSNARGSLIPINSQFDPIHLNGSGAGLGLPLARRLAHAAGGEIDCLPMDEGEGATFVLRLPRG
jgi:two-component system, OmpR family, sensor kinase